MTWKTTNAVRSWELDVTLNCHEDAQRVGIVAHEMGLASRFVFDTCIAEAASSCCRYPLVEEYKSSSVSHLYVTKIVGVAPCAKKNTGRVS